MHNISIPYRIFGIFILVCSLTGCIGSTSQKSSYYVFTASEKIASMQDPVSGVIIGVGPVKIPEYLDRPEIVTRQDGNHLVVHDFHRWGDSLESQTIHVLAENLSARLNTDNVVIYPWEKPLVPEYQLYIDFRRFDGNLGGPVILQAVWWIVETAEDKQLMTQRSSITVPINNDTFETYISTQNAALEKLSLEIAKVFITILKDQK